MQNKIDGIEEKTLFNDINIIIMFLLLGCMIYIIYSLSLKSKSEKIQLIQNNKWEVFSVVITKDLNYFSYIGRSAYTITLPISANEHISIECKSSKIKPLCQQLKNEKFPSITKVAYYKGILDENNYIIYLKGIFYKTENGSIAYYNHRSLQPYHDTKLSKQYIHLIFLVLFGLLFCLFYSYIIFIYKPFPKHFKVKLIILIFGIFIFKLISIFFKII